MTDLQPTDADRPTHVLEARPHGSRRADFVVNALSSAGLRIARWHDGTLDSQLARRDLDVLVVRREALGAKELAAIDRSSGDPDSPSVVVLGHNFQALERATLLASGVTHVVEGDLGMAGLEHTLTTITSAESVSASHNDEPRLADFLSRSAYMRRFLETVRKVVDATSTLLITGETGVGKERLARAIHAESPRGGAPFVSVNCGALPDALLESELFGHRKGAFTGAADNQPGRFDAADGGTLFLDEIGEMPLHLQVKLLGALERREITPVGAAESHTVDVRVIAATNRNLIEEVTAGRMREDLYYRLNVVPLTVPALRERREDIPDLVGSLMAWFRRHLDRPRVQRIHPAALAQLVGYEWPGNVRQLANVLERAVLLCESDEIGLGELDLGPWPLPVSTDLDAVAAPEPPAAEGPRGDLPADWRSLSLRDLREQAADRVERAYLVALLQDVGGVVKEAAARSGLAPRSFYDRLRRHGLRGADYRNG
ncbi:MAG: AAA domain-containing protein [Planctomycetaceae bacterium]|nr:AAA domain-containing protein [Planctomycetaceae bacterium]